MDYNYNQILLESRQIANKTSLVWLNIGAGIVALLWGFSLLGFLPVSTWVFNFMAPVCCAVLLIPILLNYLFHFSDFAKTGKKGIKIQMLSILSCSIVSVFLLSVTLSHYVILAWIFPVLIACQYSSKKVFLTTYFAGFIALMLSYFISLYIGVWDYNMMSSPDLNGYRNITTPIMGYAVLYLIPKVVLYCLSLPLLYSITKRTELLLKKQRLSYMAHEAKKTLSDLQDFPDTFITDCKIKMRYLAKNGIDVDTALTGMEDNIEKYNDFVLTFIGESHRKEDELFSLMDTDTLIHYASKVHALRIKANALGLTNLTDTTFFHEMEAYAGNLEIVQANWEKLSFEWDEACDIFTDYIQSLGLKNHACDAKGHQITFQEWGEQLHEAFHALDAFDAATARNILNNLLKYQIDADINKNLERIVANIDDILKA